MDDKRIRPGVWIGVVAFLALVVVGVALLPGRRSPAPASTPDQIAAARPTASPAGSTAERSRTSAHAAAPAGPVQQPEYIEGLVYGDIDLREARALMPDNLYWKLGSPTKDPDVLAARDEERRKRNEEYGRVLAGDANEDEVRAYYDYRRRLSSDYLQFAEFMARRYHDSDNKEFVGMLELAMKMHAQKLKDLDGELDAALQKSRDAAKARDEWQRQKQELGGGGAPPPDENDDQPGQ